MIKAQGTPLPPEWERPEWEGGNRFLTRGREGGRKGGRKELSADLYVINTFLITSCVSHST